jgi:hypothetical protein
VVVSEIEVTVDESGTHYHTLNGVLHRVGGPAVEHPKGYKEYRVDGVLHREDGPAIEWSDGGRDYYQHGKFHRLDGPAIEYSDWIEYWVNNIRYRTREDYEAAGGTGWVG